MSSDGCYHTTHLMMSLVNKRQGRRKKGEGASGESGWGRKTNRAPFLSVRIRLGGRRLVVVVVVVVVVGRWKGVEW